jgi:TonB family protein
MTLTRGRCRRFWATMGWIATLFVPLTGFAWGQTAGTPVRDRTLESAESLVGKALFLRGFYLANDLSYNASGVVTGAPKVGDWTVAAVNVLKASRRGPDEIELDGVRAAIRYNADQHQFERHPLNDEKMRILVKVDGDEHGFERAVQGMFAVGIDPALQRAMPAYWQHYFNPGLEWPTDGLNGVAVYPTFGMPNQPKDVDPAKAEHKVDAKFTGFAEKDKVRGTVLLQLVVDAEGVPRRISVARPLGYGLDESAVEAMAKWRFSPGVREDKPVATGIVVAQDFEFVPLPGRR